MYDPFIRGRFSVGVRTIDAPRSKCEIWYPAEASHFGQDYAAERLDVYRLDGTTRTRTQDAVRDAETASGQHPHPLVAYVQNAARWKRQSATFLCTHLASHGYVVAALDDCEVADLASLLDRLLSDKVPGDIHVEPSRIGAVGYGRGGWVVLSALETEPRIRAVVALAPEGGPKPRPGMFDGKLKFKWQREVPALYLFAENDTMAPLKSTRDLFKRAPSPKTAFVLRNADHMHFLDGVEEEHEAVRTAAWPEELEWISAEMRPAAELSSGEKGHAFTSGLTLCYLDANLLWKQEARHWLVENVSGKFAARGIEVVGSGRAE